MTILCNKIIGYGAKIDDLRWDLDLLQDNYNLDSDKIEILREFWKNYYEIDHKAWDLILEIGLRMANTEVDCDGYLYFKISDIAKKYPKASLGELDEIAVKYAKELGFLNPDEFKYMEYVEFLD